MFLLPVFSMISAAACRPFVMFRQPMMTLAFLQARIRAVSLPMPVFPPVITTVLPK